MKPFFSHTRLIPSTSNEPSLTVLGRIPSIAPYPIGYRDSSQCQELGSEGKSQPFGTKVGYDSQRERNGFISYKGLAPSYLYLSRPYSG